MSVCLVLDPSSLCVILISMENREGKRSSVLGSAQGHEEGVGAVARSRWVGGNSRLPGTEGMFEPFNSIKCQTVTHLLPQGVAQALAGFLH